MELNNFNNIFDFNYSFIECIISERMSQIRDTLADIDILSTACHTASSRLSSLRLSKLHLNRETMNSTNRTQTNDEDEEEVTTTQKIQHLIIEK
jgi:myosin-9